MQAPGAARPFSAAPSAIMLIAVGIVRVAGVAHRLIPVVPPRRAAAVLLLPGVITGIAPALVSRDQLLRPLILSCSVGGATGNQRTFPPVVPAWLFYTTDWTAPNLEHLGWAMRISGPGRSAGDRKSG